jgi:hypothetical protein
MWTWAWYYWFSYYLGLIIPEIVSVLSLIPSQAFFFALSPSAKINLSSSCYVNNWNAIIYILHEFLANRSNFFAECGGEHHDLLAMWCASEDFLNVFTHVCWDEREEKRLIVSGMFGK